MSTEQIIEQGEDPGLTPAQMSEGAGALPGMPASSDQSAQRGRENAGEGQVVGSPAVPGPQRLIEGEVIRPRHGSTRALVPVPPGTCPACGADLHVGSSTQAAMFIHGGFGEVRRHTERSCSCGWNGVGAGDFVSENPRSLA